MSSSNFIALDREEDDDDDDDDGEDDDGVDFQPVQIIKKKRSVAKRTDKAKATSSERELIGKHKEKEIALILDQECEITDELEKKFSEKLEKGHKFAIFRIPCRIKSLFRWTHRPLSGGVNYL